MYVQYWTSHSLPSPGPNSQQLHLHVDTIRDELRMNHRASEREREGGGACWVSLAPGPPYRTSAGGELPAVSMTERARRKRPRAPEMRLTLEELLRGREIKKNKRKREKVRRREERRRRRESRREGATDQVDHALAEVLREVDKADAESSDDESQNSEYEPRQGGQKESSCNESQDSKYEGVTRRAHNIDFSGQQSGATGARSQNSISKLGGDVHLAHPVNASGRVDYSKEVATSDGPTVIPSGENDGLKRGGATWLQHASKVAKEREDSDLLKWLQSRKAFAPDEVDKFVGMWSNFYLGWKIDPTQCLDFQGMASCWNRRVVCPEKMRTADELRTYWESRWHHYLLGIPPANLLPCHLVMPL